jgi:hypothetical protein
VEALWFFTWMSAVDINLMVDPSVWVIATGYEFIKSDSSSLVV